MFRLLFSRHSLSSVQPLAQSLTRGAPIVQRRLPFSVVPRRPMGITDWIQGTTIMGRKSHHQRSHGKALASGDAASASKAKTSAAKKRAAKGKRKQQAKSSILMGMEEQLEAMDVPALDVHDGPEEAGVKPKSNRKLKNKDTDPDHSDDRFGLFSAQPGEPRPTRDFAKEDQYVTMQNEHRRFAPAPKKAGVAVLRMDPKSKARVADVYPFPVEEEADLTIDLDPESGMIDPPLMRPLEDFYTFKSYGKERVGASSPGGTKFFKVDSAGIEVDGNPGELGYFRPLRPGKEQEQGTPFWGSSKKLNFFKPKLSKADREGCLGGDGESDCQSVDKRISKIAQADIDFDIVLSREGVKRAVSQNKVVGRSARDIVEEFALEHDGVMDREMEAKLRKAYSAVLGFSMASYDRPEHLHMVAHSLDPGNPQRKENLAAATKWSNTKMMLLERWVKWLAYNCPKSSAHVFCEMVLFHGRTDIAEHINFVVTTRDRGVTIKLDLSIDPWLKYPVYASAWQVGATIGTANSIHRGVVPKTWPVRAGDNPGASFKSDDGEAPKRRVSRDHLYNTVYAKGGAAASARSDSASDDVHTAGALDRKRGKSRRVSSSKYSADVMHVASTASRDELVQQYPPSLQARFSDARDPEGEFFDKDAEVGTSGSMFSIQYETLRDRRKVRFADEEPEMDVEEAPAEKGRARHG